MDYLISQSNILKSLVNQRQKIDNIEITKTIDQAKYIPVEEVSFAGEQNDIGYNVDSGDTIYRALDIYAGEPVVEKIPGRGRSGSLEPADDDIEDWYRFTVCEGQTIQVSLITNQDYNCEIYNSVGVAVGTSYTAEETGVHFIQVIAEDKNNQST